MTFHNVWDRTVIPRAVLLFTVLWADPPAAMAVPALEMLTDHKDPSVMWRARHALGAIRGDSQ